MPRLSMLMWLAACAASDPDGDGLPSGDERDLGTDPRVADSDGDGMADGEEVRLGLDPLDAADDGYTGAWPLQEPSTKDALAADANLDVPIALGSRLPRLRMVDQYGDMVDLYDFAGHGEPVLIDLSAGWCVACMDFSAYLADDKTAADLGLDAEAGAALDEVKARVLSRDLLWITVMGESRYYFNPTQEDAARWADSYPLGLPVLADTQEDLYAWILRTTGALPTLVALDSDMRVQAWSVSVETVAEVAGR